MTTNLKIETADVNEPEAPEESSPEECEREYWRIFGIEPEFDGPVPGEEKDEN